MRHFERLVDQTRGLVEWWFAFNATAMPAPEIDLTYADPAKLMPTRFAQMHSAGGMIASGCLDLLVLPCVAASPHQQNWLVEFDVDYAGDWREFFEAQARIEADLLTTTLLNRYSDPNWYWWPSAHSPRRLPPQRMWRAFMPIMRLSQNFVSTYVTASEEPWRGHFEFLAPTVASEHGLVVRDLNGARPGQECADLALYTNTPEDYRLYPGTFRWRPALDHYFHETPQGFERGKLHHPIKVPEALSG